MSEIVWQEPPPSRGGGGKGSGRLQRLAADLRAQPGRWALVGSYAGSGGSARQHLRDEGLEVTGRSGSNGRIDIYARWPETK